MLRRQIVVQHVAFGFNLHEAPHMGDVGESKPKPVGIPSCSFCSALVISIYIKICGPKPHTSIGGVLWKVPNEDLLEPAP